MKRKQLIALAVVLLVSGGLFALVATKVQPAKTVDPHDHGSHGAGEPATHDDHDDQADYADEDGHADHAGEGEHADHADHEDKGDHSGKDGHADHGDEAGTPGSHGGRMLSRGDLGVELAIFERGTPPEFHLYVYEKGVPIAPEDVDATVEVTRLGGRHEKFTFKRVGDHFVSEQVVEGPHSFDVSVGIEMKNGVAAQWNYASYEFRTMLGPEAIRGAGIEISSAGSARIQKRIEAYGRIAPNDERTKHVIPRFAGIVKQVNKRLGDRVSENDVLAVVESNESLRPYEIRSNLSGVVIERHAMPGEFADENETIFVVADLSTVWADLSVNRQDFSDIKIGQRVTIDGGSDMPKVEGTISYLSPFGATNTQTMLARVVVPNRDGQWRPGLFVSGEIFVNEHEAPIAVEAGAVQTFQDWTVVFVTDGSAFEPQPVELGRRSTDWVEVLAGLPLGMRYVSKNSFIIKADILKAGAAHEH
ncbi:MAG: efflux RND transporter periplasmic adaptor subunit [bacterium]